MRSNEFTLKKLMQYINVNVFILYVIYSVLMQGTTIIKIMTSLKSMAVYKISNVWSPYIFIVCIYYETKAAH
jgi:hypothetical protein